MSVQIKDNLKDNATELWIDGEFRSSWLLFEIPEHIRGRIIAMLNNAVEVGERRKAAEIRKCLGCK